MRIIALIAVGILIFDGCARLNRRLNLENDNIFEELIEEIIESETGLDIDLTPSSAKI